MARVRIRRIAAEEVEAFEAKLGSPPSLGEAIHRLRQDSGETLRTFAERLQVSSQHLSDVERGSRHLTPERAAEWAHSLGLPRAVFVRLALQRYVDDLGLRVRVEAA